MAAVNTSAGRRRTILAADVGGTKTVVGIMTGPPWNLHAAERRRIENADHPSFEAMLAEALVEAGTPAIDVACVAAAGPVVDGTIRLTNLPWTVSAERLRHLTGAASARLLNDLEATALGSLLVPPERLVTIQAGDPPPGGGHVVAIAPGTGLGEAILCWDGANHLPVASEGGHVDFAPRGALQARLLEWVAARHGHVSYERVASGPGLVTLYEFVREHGFAPEAPDVRAALAAGDPPAIITTEALAGRDPLCEAALDLFVRILGAKAGNLALQAVAFGGVMVAGGMAGHVAPALTDGRFLAAFLDKGRHRSLLERMPLRLVLEADAAWLGAAAYATREGLGSDAY